jgi:hypothetical protein
MIANAITARHRRNEVSAHWPASEWAVNVRAGHQHKTVLQRRPFALIGSHPCCHLRVSSRSVAEVAYLACCLGSEIRVWDLSDTTCLVGSRLSYDQTIDVGPCTISFSTEQENLDEIDEEAGFVISCKVSTAAGICEKTLRNGVTLLSDSTYDLTPNSENLATHAAVNHGGSLWIIDLAAEKMKRTDRIRRLSMFENDYSLGNSLLTLTEILDTAENVALPSSAEARDTANKIGKISSKQKKRKNRGKENTQQGFSGTEGTKRINQSAQGKMAISDRELLEESNDVLASSDELLPASHLGKLTQSNQAENNGPFDISSVDLHNPVITGVTNAIDLLKELTNDAKNDRKTENPGNLGVPEDQPLPGVAKSAPLTTSQVNPKHPEIVQFDRRNSAVTDNGIAAAALAETKTPHKSKAVLTKAVAKQQQTDPIQSDLSLRKSDVNQMANAPQNSRLPIISSNAPGGEEHDNSVKKSAQDAWFTSFAVGEDLEEVSESKAFQPASSESENAIRLTDSDEVQPTPQSSDIDRSYNSQNRQSRSESAENQFDSTETEDASANSEISCGNSSAPAELSGEHRISSENPRHELAETQRLAEPMIDSNSIPADASNSSPIGAVVVTTGDGISPEKESDASKPKHESKSKALQHELEEHMDMSSLSYFPNDTEPQPAELSLESTYSGSESHPALPPQVLPPPVEATETVAAAANRANEQSSNQALQQSPTPAAYQARVRSLSDYKIDPDELTTEISVRLANHVAPRRGFFSVIRKLFVVSTIVAVHVAVFYFVGKRVYELLYVID